MTYDRIFVFMYLLFLPAWKLLIMESCKIMWCTARICT